MLHLSQPALAFSVPRFWRKVWGRCGSAARGRADGKRERELFLVVCTPSSKCKCSKDSPALSPGPHTDCISTHVGRGSSEPQRATSQIYANTRAEIETTFAKTSPLGIG